MGLTPTNTIVHRIRYSIVVGLCLFAGTLLGQQRVDVSSAAELQALFEEPVGRLEVRLSPGTYDLVPRQAVDTSCGNCVDPATRVHVTTGLHIRGDEVKLIGPSEGSAVIVTNAGYGLWFDGCRNGLIEHLVVTGGVRDTSGNATDAAVVIRGGRVEVKNCVLRDNIGDSIVVRKTVVGVMGIAVREEGTAVVTGNQILRNSWDGIAVFRKGKVIVQGNLIDGVDKAVGQHVGGGRGVAVGVTWDGKAEIRNNLIKRYWKGVGLFVDAEGTVEGNIVEDIVTWGISLWDAEKGVPAGRIRNNIIYRTGACGASITRSSKDGDPGYFSGNVLTLTAQNPRYDSPDYYCYQCALAVHAAPAQFSITGNLFYANRRATGDLPDHDMTREDFLKGLDPIVQAFRANAVLRRSEFLTEYYPSLVQPR